MPSFSAWCRVSRLSASPSTVSSPMTRWRRLTRCASSSSRRCAAALPTWWRTGEASNDVEARVGKRQARAVKGATGMHRPRVMSSGPASRPSTDSRRCSPAVARDLRHAAASDGHDDVEPRSPTTSSPAHRLERADNDAGRGRRAPGPPRRSGRRPRSSAVRGGGTAAEGAEMRIIMCTRRPKPVRSSGAVQARSRRSGRVLQRSGPFRMPHSGIEHRP